MLTSLSNLGVHEALLLFKRLNVLANQRDRGLDLKQFLLCLENIVVMGAFWSQLQTALSLQKLVTLHTELGILLRFLFDLSFNLCALLLLLYFLDLQELIVDHLLGVLKDPLPDFSRVDFL